MKYAALWAEVQESALADTLKRHIYARLSDPTYSEAYVKLLVQWTKVALYTGDERELRLLIYGYAPRSKKQKKEQGAD